MKAIFPQTARTAKGEAAILLLCSWLGWGRNITERSQTHRGETTRVASRVCS